MGSVDTNYGFTMSFVFGSHTGQMDGKTDKSCNSAYLNSCTITEIISSGLKKISVQ